MSAPRSYNRSRMWLHVDNWLASESVALLSMAGQGAYFDLLLREWQGDGDGLPADPAILKALVGWSGRGWDATWTILAPLFPVSVEDSRRRHSQRHNNLFLRQRRVKKVGTAQGGAR